MSDLDRLFYWRGITSEYQNYRGETTQVPLDNRLTLLKAMGVDADDPEALKREVFRLDVEPWRHWFSKLIVVPAGENSYFDINLQPKDLAHELDWRLADELGKVFRTGKASPARLEKVGEYVFNDVRYERYRVPLGALPPNYYRLNVLSEIKSESTTLAAFPAESWQGALSDSSQKVWGVIVQLYTLRSERNWGIGDFTDLRELLEALAKKGAGVVGLNPLHALSPYLDEHFSPYSPSDRRFINPLYIDPYWIIDFEERSKQQLDKSLLAELRADTKVNYGGVRQLKYPVFQAMFENFIAHEQARQSERYQEFIRFVELQGDSLLKFAHFEARHQSWPKARFVLTHVEKLGALEEGLLSASAHSDAQLAVLFHCYLQWLADKQLRSCQAAAESLGMKVGLIRDLAVGADGGCAEVSGNPKLFCRASSVGAPPDPFAHTGQNWGLPPLIPTEMRKTGFEHFRQLLRLNMQHCGALRIDHAMSLQRLWWCPPGKTADFGAYVYYPEHEMMGLLLLESHLNKCAIIAEDLGVVPEEFRQRLSKAKIFTNKVFYFEKIFHDKFKKPEEYDAHALAMVNNHDLPSLTSWWNGSDLVLRNTLDLFEEGMSYEDMCAARKRDKEHILAMLYDAGLYPSSWHGRPVNEAMDESLIEAILLFVSRTRSRIFVLQLEDLLLMDDPINVPGTFKEHDNWQRKISHNVSDIFADDRIDALLDRIHHERQR